MASGAAAASSVQRQDHQLAAPERPDQPQRPQPRPASSETGNTQRIYIRPHSIARSVAGQGWLANSPPLLLLLPWLPLRQLLLQQLMLLLPPPQWQLLLLPRPLLAMQLARSHLQLGPISSLAGIHPRARPRRTMTSSAPQNPSPHLSGPMATRT